jgi:hypothetical protein
MLSTRTRAEIVINVSCTEDKFCPLEPDKFLLAPVEPTPLSRGYLVVLPQRRSPGDGGCTGASGSVWIVERIPGGYKVNDANGISSGLRMPLGSCATPSKVNVPFTLGCHALCA